MNAQDRNQFSGRISAVVLVSTLLAFSDVSTAYAAGLTPGDIVITAQLSSTDYGLLEIDPVTGNRTILSDNNTGTGQTFSYPEGVTQMSNGDLLVMDQGNETLFEVDPSTGNRTVVSNNSGVGTGPNFSVAFQARQFGSQILVTNSSAGGGAPAGVLSVDPATGNRSILSAFPAPGSGPAFFEPIGFAVLGTNLFVADISNGVFEVDTLTGNRTFLRFATVVSPVDLVADGAGHLLISSYALGGDPSVHSYDLTTTLTYPVSDSHNGSGPLLQSPTGIDLAANGTILLADVGLNAVLQIDPLTGNRTILSDATHGTGPSFSNPQGLLVVPNVPEPSTIVLAALGVLALLAYRWRRA